MRFNAFPALAGVLIMGGCAISSPPGQAGPPAPAPAQKYLTQAEELRDQGFLTAALASFELALEENPHLTAAHLGVGHINRQQSEYQTASVAYQHAVASDANNFDATYYLGLMRQMLGQLDQAILAYHMALSIDPTSGPANRDLAATYLQLGQPARALPYAQRATVHDPRSQAAWCNLATTYFLMGKYQQAIDAFREAAELGDLADRILPGLADAHLKLRHYQRASNVLSELVRRSPSASAYERLGYASFKLHEFDKALKNYRHAYDLDDQNTPALNGIGASLLTMYIHGGRKKTQQRDQAYQAWRRSVLINNDQPRIVDLLARYSRL